MHGPLCFRPPKFAKMQQAVESLHTVHRNRQPTLFGQFHLTAEQGGLYFQIRPTQTVKAALPDGHHLCMFRQLPQTGKKSAGILCFPRPPRMNAGRIEPARHRTEKCRTHQPFARHVNDGRAGYGEKIMCVEIH